MFYKAWFDKGVRYVMDLIDNQGKFYNLNSFNEKTSVNTNFIQYQGVIECIKKELRDANGDLRSDVQGPIIPKFISTLLKQNKGSQNIYNILNKNKETPSGKIKWNQLYNIMKSHGNIFFRHLFRYLNVQNLDGFR